MAYQIQYPPQTATIFESLMRGRGAVGADKQQSLQNQQLQKELSTYDQRMKAQMAKQQLESQYKQSQLQGQELKNMLQSKYGEAEILADMNYKNSIGSSAEANAQSDAMQAYLAGQRLPLEVEQIRLQNEELKRQQQYLQRFMAENGIQAPAQPQINNGQMQGGQVGLPPLDGMAPASSFNQQAVMETPEAKTLLDIPDNYLPSNEAPMIDYGYEKFREARLPATELEGMKARAATQGREDVKAYRQYAQNAGASSTVAADENAILDEMKGVFRDIPVWNKGQIQGYLGPLSSKSKVYEGLYSDVVLNSLGDLKGTASEADRMRVESKYPNLKFPDSAMEELITYRQIINDRKIEKQDYISRNPDRTPEELEAGWNKWMIDHPMNDNPRYKEYLERQRANMSPKQRIDDEIKQLRQELEGK